MSHLWTQGPIPKRLPFVKEEVCRKSGFPHWLSLLLMALRLQFFLLLLFFFLRKIIKNCFLLTNYSFIYSVFCTSLHLSVYPFRINTAPSPPSTNLLQLKSKKFWKQKCSFCTLNIFLATISRETDPS